MLYALRQSLEKRRRVQIIYQAKSGKLTQRDVTVYRLNDVDVIVWCHMKGAVRTLKQTNILAVEDTRSSTS
ncbi:WYL domain-containing protein [Geomicrobium sp. JCM 19039]|uniref:WYL domain-containing protein n=1 Tax=Geomicrobium sp. JCM 19039 TaxID=1460636 RepID=UPI00045F3333|nr:WYL domain-containing protein [Geomicrobium sp. JCM 19039]GAK12159.1 hypothetical protein JCM19039_1900 [Geomicrobium sp. JCM 19039]